ncbi:MAG TPA: dipeptide epimerase [Candidatus Paceibacterota bacterium]|nr:dipeptide epimerase [Candidatus Paceibacterota bacterium]HRZ53850.1 dipeptide epimerase [Candidatus Paceibacterota bacterium]
MKLRIWRYDLQLAHRWTIARGLEPGGAGGKTTSQVVLAELTDNDGIVGLGEAAPSSRYGETTDTAVAFLERVDANRLSFADPASSLEYARSLAPGQFAAKGALDVALSDGAARRAGKPLHTYLGLGFAENKHVTSFSIGIATPEIITQKTRAAESYPVLKLKLGSPHDRDNLGALRAAAPRKPVRVDANEAWKTKEIALQNLEWLAQDGAIQFVEQPMPANATLEDMVWLKARSPLPLMGDESYVSIKDVERCAAAFHSVNVKLVKVGGVSPGFEALRAARQAGLQTMLGCMIESSVLISAAAHLADLTDYLDLDGNLLVTNDPFCGVKADRGLLSFAGAPDHLGLCVRPREMKRL